MTPPASTSPAKGERGAALLMVLLLVAVMAALAALALERLRLATRLAANGAALDQARALAFGAEALAASRITALNAIDPARTTLRGGWSGRAERVELPGGGVATLRVSDGANCFNLNSVAQGAVPTKLTARPTGVAQFMALMTMLGVAQEEARHVAASLADWVDADSLPDPEGAEDETYRKASPPYRAANTLLAEVSELRAVAGVTPQIYARLRPWVCALPTTDLSPINVNTLSPDQAVLVAMLVPDRLDVARARAIIAARPPDGFASIDDFWRLPALAAITPAMDVRRQAGLRTRWFRLDLDVALGGAHLAETALIDGGLRPARLVLRRWGSDD